MVKLPPRWRSLSLCAGLTASLAWGFTTTSCILPDQCILVVVHGDDWCSRVLGARMWPVGSPDLAVPVVDADDNWPEGCRCYNAAEDEILEFYVPPLEYQQFSAEIETAARNNCDALVPAGWDHNCYDLTDQGPEITVPLRGEEGVCVGDCAWTKVPKDGCGSEPTPYDCEHLVDRDSAGETGGGAEGADTTRATPTIEAEVSWNE